jgi:hypothetical protein
MKPWRGKGRRIGGWLGLLGVALAGCGSNDKAAGPGASPGGASTTGGRGAGGASTTGGRIAGGNPAADPTETARVQGWLTTTTSGLPNYAYTNISQYFPTVADLSRLVNAIVNSCTQFAPAEQNWQLYCEAVITSAIVAESSYNPSSNNLDTYGTRSLTGGGTANDPTVGLLQIRFSSTVQDYNYYGPLAKMAAIGCAWPAELPGHANDEAFWATAGGTSYVAFMQDVACNIGLATWYYFINATGNGGSSATYAYQYCQGSGVAGTMVVGLLSHLMGPGFTRPPDATNSYVTGIKSRFTSLLGGTLPSPDPFTQSLSPEQSKYCG